MRIRIKRKINEGWRDSSWRFQDKKVTIGDIIDYIGDKIIEINPCIIKLLMIPTNRMGEGRPGFYPNEIH